MSDIDRISVECLLHHVLFDEPVVPAKFIEPAIVVNRLWSFFLVFVVSNDLGMQLLEQHRLFIDPVAIDLDFIFLPVD